MSARYRVPGASTSSTDIADGVAFDDWMAGADGPFGIHPSGVLVFLPPAQVTAMDEYEDSDPYSVEANLNSTFQQNRIEITCDLVREGLTGAPGPKRVLDVGAGEGHITDHFRAIDGVTEVVALDASLSAGVRGKELFPNLEFVVADAYKMPFEDGYFDVVVLNNIWEHVPDPLLMLAEMKRVCRPGGCVVISTPSRYRVANLARVLRGKDVAFMSRHHVTEYTVGQVKEQLTYGGFDVLAVRSRYTPPASFKGRAIQNTFAAIVKAVHSHHRLDPTVFYLARNVRPAGLPG